MATSGTYAWTETRNTIITNALRKLSVLASGTTANTNQLSDGNDALNALIKAFAADGMPVWATVPYSFTTVATTSAYSIGIGQTLNTVAPLKVLQAFYTVSGGNNVPMNVYNRYDFNMLPQQLSNSGTPVNLYYQPSTSGVYDMGTINLWPTPIDSTTTITINYQRPYQDVSGGTDNVDFPSYWIQALIYNLAWALAPEYGVPPMDRNVLAAEAKYWKDQALGYGSEEGSMFLMPSSQGM